MTDELPGLSPTLSTDITTRQPSNTNYVLNTGFYFNIFRMPNVQYFCQEANLPGVNAGEIRQPTRFIDVIHLARGLLFDQPSGDAQQKCRPVVGYPLHSICFLGNPGGGQIVVSSTWYGDCFSTSPAAMLNRNADPWSATRCIPSAFRAT